MEDLSDSTTQQTEFIEYLLQVKYQELEANQKLEHKMASEFKVNSMTHEPWVFPYQSFIIFFKKTMRIYIMEEVMRWRNYFARSRQVRKSSDWVTFPFYHDQESASSVLSWLLLTSLCSFKLPVVIFDYRWGHDRREITNAPLSIRSLNTKYYVNKTIITLSFRPIFEVRANVNREWGHICKFFVF